MANLTDEQVGDTLDYLGGRQPVASQRLTTLPSASAAGGGTVAAPVTGSPTSATGGGGGGGDLGGGLEAGGPGLSPLQQLIQRLGQAKGVAEKFVGGNPDEPTRGATGGTSLADVVRSGPGVGAGSAASSVVPGTPAALAQEAAAAAASSSPASAIGPISGSGIDAATGGASAGGNFALDAGIGAGTDAATQALIEGAEFALPSLAEGLTGITTAGLIPILESFFGVGLFGKGGGNPESKLRETKGIRDRFTGSWDAYSDAPNTLAQVASVDKSLPPEQQRVQLQDLLDRSNYQLQQGPNVSQFLSTEGGKQAGLVKPVDVSGFEKTSGMASRDAVLSYTLAADRLASMGVDTKPEEGAWASPQGMLGILFAQAGVDTSKMGGDYTSALSPEELSGLTTPGKRMDTIRSIMTRLNPDFANSVLGQDMQAASGDGAPAIGTPTEAAAAITGAEKGSGLSLGGPEGALGFANEILAN